MTSQGLIDSLLDCSDCILSVRDTIGAVLKPQYFITRTWSGAEPGDGTAVDVPAQILPTGHIVDLSLNFRALEAGVVKQGDILLKMLSKHLYPTRSVFESTSTARNIEKFIKVGAILYETISIRERYLTWDLQLRPLSDQTGY